MKEWWSDWWQEWWWWRWRGEMIMEVWCVRKRQIETWLTKWMRQLIPEMRWCIAKGSVVEFIFSVCFYWCITCSVIHLYCSQQCLMHGWCVSLNQSFIHSFIQQLLL